MARTARKKPYLWPTWLVGLLAGEAHCWWAVWFKAHYKDWERRPSGNDLTQWAADHAGMVDERVAALKQAGWLVSLEGQNEFRVEGATIDISGKIDIIARSGSTVRIEDCKTGKRREKDYWQVVLYMLAAVRSKLVPPTATIIGAVIYRDGVREISWADAQAGKDRVFDGFRQAGLDLQPAHVPSFRECAWCDIAECGRRMNGDAAVGQTDEF